LIVWAATGLLFAAITIWAGWQAFQVFRAPPDKAGLRAPYVFLTLAILGVFLTYQCVVAAIAAA
jgi:hypothetical protein